MARSRARTTEADEVKRPARRWPEVIDGALADRGDGQDHKHVRGPELPTNHRALTEARAGAHSTFTQRRQGAQGFFGIAHLHWKKVHGSAEATRQVGLRAHVLSRDRSHSGHVAEQEGVNACSAPPFPASTQVKNSPTADANAWLIRNRGMPTSSRVRMRIRSRQSVERWNSNLSPPVPIAAAISGCVKP